MSTVLANTITAVGGGGSTVKVNNDSTYISDGGAVTDHNLVQGLVKTWASIKGTTSTELLDSFNVTSVADTATGKSTITINNDMTNDNYSTTTSAQENTCVHAHTAVAAGSSKPATTPGTAAMGPEHASRSSTPCAFGFSKTRLVQAEFDESERP